MPSRKPFTQNLTACGTTRTTPPVRVVSMAYFTDFVAFDFFATAV